MNYMETGRAWLAAQRVAHQSRQVTYRRGSTAIVDLDAGIGQSQLDNLNFAGVEPSRFDLSMMAATVANRDYIVAAADLGSLWPPRSGDLIDDANDRAGVINRFQVMSLPSQNPWRWLNGGYQVSARIHAKFLRTFRQLWADDFAGTNGTSLANHSPSTPDDGEYTLGEGDVILASNRIVAGDEDAQAYFDPGEEKIKAYASINLNTTAADLANRHAEFGIGVRCEASGAGQRDGYYCTAKIGYVAGVQSVRRLRIIQRLAGVDTEAAGVDLSSALSLTTTYRLQVEDDGESRILATLTDSTGEVAIASASKASPLFDGRTTCAVAFAHHADIDISLPWIDGLRVEA